MNSLLGIIVALSAVVIISLLAGIATSLAEISDSLKRIAGKDGK